jgi:hypothetical protein
VECCTVGLSCSPLLRSDEGSSVNHFKNGLLKSSGAWGHNGPTQVIPASQSYQPYTTRTETVVLSPATDE